MPTCDFYSSTNHYQSHFQSSPQVMPLQYGGGCQVQWRVPSTVEGYLAVQWGGYHEVQWRVRSTVESYHAVQWMVQVRWRAIMQYSGGLSFGKVIKFFGIFSRSGRLNFDYFARWGNLGLLGFYELRCARIGNGSHIKQKWK